MTSHRLIFGRNVIQVPLKHPMTNDFVILVLSQLEFDTMAVHVPQYESLSPEELQERITQVLKELEIKKRPTCLDDCSSSTFNAHYATDDVALDSLSAFQSRLMELEYERKRLHTKLKGSKALQIRLTEENAALRVQVEQQAIHMEEVVQENELLRDQALHFGGNVAKWKRVAVTTLRKLTALKQELQVVRQQVKSGHDEMALMVESAMTIVVEDVNRREQVLQQSFLAEKREKEAIAEKYYDLSGRIRVFCRLRPRKESREETKCPALLMPRPNNLLVSHSGKEFAFDKVFGPQSTQSEVYAQIEPLIVSFTDGYNACIMAYGQTGTGKTHTMVGNGQGLLEHSASGLTLHANAGVIPRALQHVFAMVKKRQMTYVDSLRVSMVEIYNDQILDLLHENNTKGGKNTVARNETEFTSRDVSDYGHVDAVMRDGNANRNTAATKMNLESSRSHALVFLHLNSQHRETREVRRSTLCLVDLAGSERISRSQVKGNRLRETQHINKSLAALGDVVYGLQHKAKHIPYRNSKLTYLLRDMISGQAKTLLMLQLSPDTADVEETTCSLQFGARVSQVRMGAVRPSVESGAVLKLQEENRSFRSKTVALETQLIDLQQQCLQQGEEIHKAQSSKEALERQVRLLVGCQRGGKVADDLDLCETSPSDHSPFPTSRPTSPTCSAKSSQNVLPTASAPSARSTRLARCFQSSAAPSRQPYPRQSCQVSSSPRLTGTTCAPNSAVSSSTVSQHQCLELTMGHEERRMSLSAASQDRVVDSDIRRKSLSTASASTIVDYDSRRKSLSALQTRSMLKLATPRSLRAKRASPSEGRVPLHPSSRTRPADSMASSASQNTVAGRVSRAQSAQAVGSSRPHTFLSSSASPSKLTRTLHRATSPSLRTSSRKLSRTPARASAAIPKTGGDTRRSSLTRSSPSLSSDASTRRSMASFHSSSGWK
ncbi:unnamed protein product [Peronospora belbahrii]|uniref:Kinesin-like protein n=1 Tax=Peronospora belbahrii TaxID=622444 RepID=A0AAU9KTR2_9STRA|nr:unnamed protein product [Peronospora belbahrii]CAH0514740.1 unnamed protein product [Peronospora belbahrii]